jgi:hypothetical protein
VSRSANYTIQGFIYQFNKTLLEILENNEEAEITVEGIIEDIEVKSDVSTKAIQCKYHETKDKFTLSCIYKPILQMLDHYYENQKNNIEYKLYAHFPNEKIGTLKELDEKDINEIFKSTDKNLKKLIDKLKNKVNINAFCKQFTLEFGPSLNDLIAMVRKSLIVNEMPENDIDTLIYPNSIQVIADLSILPNPLKRKITKGELLKYLLSIKKTAISRWTMELKTLDKILKTRKLQLRENLSKNSRLRYFIISEKSIENFNENIVNFISEYLTKYHFKEVHDKTPVFCLDCTSEIFNNIRIRLHRKKIKVNDGLIAEIFDKNKFNIEPVRMKLNKKLFTEFDIKLLKFSDEAIDIFNENKCEDCFIFTELMPDGLDFEDINIEHLFLNNLLQIKFVMGMSDVYE